MFSTLTTETRKAKAWSAGKSPVRENSSPASRAFPGNQYQLGLLGNSGGLLQRKCDSGGGGTCGKGKELLTRTSTPLGPSGTPPDGGQQHSPPPDAGAPPARVDAGAPAPPATTYAGCSAAQNTQVEAARGTALAKAIVSQVTVILIRAGIGTAAQQAALTSHFGALTPTQMDTVRDRYTTIVTRLANPAFFACGSQPAQPYCGPPQNWCAGTVCPTTTSISYLCPGAFVPNCAEPNLWSVLLHESGRAAGCCPPDVQPGAGYPPAAPASLTNVYSYSGFARAI